MFAKDINFSVNSGKSTHVAEIRSKPSVVTSKPAIGGRVKTGQWEAVRD
jgi:hypothetical protein